MKTYEITYLDSKFGNTVMTIEVEVEAENESEALDAAMREDYYFGKCISIFET